MDSAPRQAKGLKKPLCALKCMVLRHFKCICKWKHTYKLRICSFLSILTQALSVLSYTPMHVPCINSFVDGRVNSCLILSSTNENNKMKMQFFLVVVLVIAFLRVSHYALTQDDLRRSSTVSFLITKYRFFFCHLMLSMHLSRKIYH